MTLQPAALPVMPPPPPSLCDAAAREPIRTAAITSSGHLHLLSTFSLLRRRRPPLAPPHCPPFLPSLPTVADQDPAGRAHGQRLAVACGASSCGRRARPAWISAPCDLKLWLRSPVPA